MQKTAILTPSRNRVENVKRLAKAFEDTQARADLWIIIDESEWHRKAYEEAAQEYDFGLLAVDNNSSGMAKPLNMAAEILMDDETYDRYEYFGFMGDDHVPRTPFWDYSLTLALPYNRAGIVYGNDLLQGGNLPTACIMTRSIVDALGGMVQPKAKHLYLDNFWKQLGTDLGSLHYRAEIIIEHMHPVARKANMDEDYARVNSQDMYEHDRQVYEEFINSKEYADLVAILKK